MPLRPETLEFIRKSASELGATRVVLFGSCLMKDEREAHDIDLGVTGLSRADALALRRTLYSSRQIPNDVDIVRMEERDWIVPLIELEGETIYES